MPKLSKETLDFRKLKCNFVNEVLRNLSNTGDPLATVSFGTSGGGIQPNYEITPVSGEPVAYRGNTHQAVEDRDQWKAGNLTEPFSRDEVEQGFDISLKSIDVAKKYILNNLKAHPEKYSHPGKDHAPLLIEAVMGGTPLAKAFADLDKVQNPKPSPQTETAPVHRDTERLISNEALTSRTLTHPMKKSYASGIRSTGIGKWARSRRALPSHTPKSMTRLANCARACSSSSGLRDIRARIRMKPASLMNMDC
jgi:hypothetical protein